MTILKGMQQAVGANAVANVSGCVDVACDNADINAVAAAVPGAKAVLVVLGNTFGGKKDHWPLCQGSTTNGCESEAHDRTTIELPGKQLAVVAAIRKSLTQGAPLVCVLVHGGAVALGQATDDCDAIVDLWVPGQMGGAALADIVFGAFSPAGRYLMHGVLL